MALFGSGRRFDALKGGASSLPYDGPGLGEGVGTLEASPVPATGAANAVEKAQSAHSARRGALFGQPSKGATALSPPVSAASPLGASMRQGFDYEAAMQRLAGDKPKVSPWAIAAAVIGDALTQNAGGRPFAVQNIMGQKQSYQDRFADAQKMLTDWQYRDHARQNEADLKAAAPFTVGRDRVQFDPASGQSSVLYDGPEDFELYAGELGLAPGSDDYFRAVEDYVLRSSGPTAHSRDKELDDYRTGNDRELETLRFGNRQRLEGLRQSNRIDTIRSRPVPAARGGGSTPGAGDGLPVVSTPAEASRLPRGSRFRTPDGRVKVVP